MRLTRALLRKKAVRRGRGRGFGIIMAASASLGQGEEEVCLIER